MSFNFAFFHALVFSVHIVALAPSKAWIMKFSSFTP